MTDRERLIELIVDVENEIFQSCPYTTDALRIENIADYLLANGVIVLPCKVGDTVYELDDFVWVGDCGDCNNFEEGWYECPSECKKTKSDNKSPECIKIIEQKISYSKLLTSMIGKDFGEKIFLTREEAEAALAKLEKGEIQNDR